jgi:hypothetical protein
MPQIVICADGLESKRGREVMRERVAVSDLESELFTAHLVERIEWALSDAHSLEDRAARPRSASPRSAERRRRSHPAAAG